MCVALLAPGPAVAAGPQDGPHHAGLVVGFGDGRVETRCVTFSEPSITGYDLLTRAGLDLTVAIEGQGAAVCAIDGVGCPADDCFCEQPQAYWSYWHLDGGSWAYSQLGATAYTLTDGAVDGWMWGDGAQPPPLRTLDQICDLPDPTATPAPPTATPSPTATPTSPPPTATPTATPAPTDAPAVTTTPSPVPTPSVWFRLDANPVSAGACTFVRWDAMHATSVLLNGEAVAPSGSREVCPETPTTYRMQVANASGEQTYELVLGVEGAPLTATETPAPAATPTATATPVPAPAATPGPTATDAPAPTATPAPPDAPTPTSSPASTATPAPSATMITPGTSPTATPLPAPTLSAPPPWLGYAVFGALLLGLGIGYVLLRRPGR
jgi:hypothetical protein